MTPLVKTIDFLREMCVAPAHEFASYGRAVDRLERVAVKEAGECASLLSAAVRTVVKQAAYCTPETQKHLRDALAALGTALASELEAHGGAQQPYYVER